MRVLIVKTSSLGDIVHMLPAVTDLSRYYAAEQQTTLEIDWLVEEAFQAIPHWHKQINNVIPVAIRRWRKQLFRPQTRQEITALRQCLQRSSYDVVLDSQGLLKSAALSYLAQSKRRCGYDKHSAREALAAFFYQQPVPVAKDLHAIERNRRLTATVFGYSYSNSINYGVHAPPLTHNIEQHSPSLSHPYVMALHGTSRVDKEWPEKAWLALSHFLARQDLMLVFPWGNKREYERAQTLHKQAENIQILPHCSLQALFPLIRAAKAVVGVDTGLMHIAAALGQVGIALYPVTQPKLTGVIGEAEGISDKLEKKRKIISLSGKNTYNTGYILELLSERL